MENASDLGKPVCLTGSSIEADAENKPGGGRTTCASRGSVCITRTGEKNDHRLQSSRRLSNVENATQHHHQQGRTTLLPSSISSARLRSSSVRLSPSRARARAIALRQSSGR